MAFQSAFIGDIAGFATTAHHEGTKITKITKIKSVTESHREHKEDDDQRRVR